MLQNPTASIDGWKTVLRRPSAILFLAWIALALFHLRPWRLSHGYLYGGDDAVYMAHLSTLVIDRDVSYDNEHTGPYLHYPVGSSYLALPGYAIGYCMDILSKNTSRLRLARDYSDSWTVVGYLMNQQLLVIAAIVMVCCWLRSEIKISQNLVAMAGLSILGSHMALYAFRRPMAHDGQLLANALMCLWLFSSVRRKTHEIPHVLLGGLITGLLLVVRWDMAAWALLGGLVLLVPFLRGATEIRPTLKSLAMYGVTVAGVFWLLQGPVWWSQFHTLWPFSADKMPAVYERLGRSGMTQDFAFLGHLFWGKDFGLFWTAPIIPLGLLTGVPTLWLLFHDIPRPTRLALVFLFMILIYGTNAYQVMKWRTQASFYGYRYLTACLVPSAFFTACALERWRKETRRYAALFTIVWITAGTLTAIPFEGNSDTLTLSIGETPYGGTGWVNNRYAIEAWKALASPATWMRVVAAGPVGVPVGLHWASRPSEQTPAWAKPIQAKFVPFQTFRQKMFLLLSTILLLIPSGAFLHPWARRMDG